MSKFCCFFLFASYYKETVVGEGEGERFDKFIIGKSGKLIERVQYGCFASFVHNKIRELLRDFSRVITRHILNDTTDCILAEWCKNLN